MKETQQQSFNRTDNHVCSLVISLLMDFVSIFFYEKSILVSFNHMKIKTDIFNDRRFFLSYELEYS